MSDTDVTLLETADVPPHQHPEYVSYGQRGIAQTVPYYAANNPVPSSDLGALLAVRMHVPAGQEIVALGIAIDIPSGGYINGTWRAGLYSADDRDFLEPLAVSAPSPAVPGVWWKATFHRPLPAADTARPLWAVIEFGQVEGMTVLTNKPYRSELLGGFCYRSSDHAELPARIALGAWTPESRVPLIALY
ncbi:hypothetical protein [Nonomuraea sp. NPDC005650]|uniref:hypothetical protein n=1 Tax=Nonomuraea sp. NPDC005650 TaxID=3157045 RepID=UPI0033BF6C3C